MSHNKNVSNVPIIKYETEPNQIERNEENENIQILRRIRRKNLRKKCCMKCDKKFMTFLQLYSHSKIHKYKKLKRMNYLAKNTTFAPYKQTNHFITKQLLENAIEEEKSYCCSICEMKFTILKDLEMHKKTHMYKKSLFECDQCQKKFKYSSSLIIHKRIHTKEKPFQCDQCDYKCSRSSNLKVHKRIHSQVKPFQCDQCEKKFTQSQHLKVHKRIHSNEKPFKCGQCEFKCKRSCSLTIHKRTHTGVKPYECSQCDMKFTQSGSLQVHKRIHTK